jgi:polyisoprenoid-binding protein YceI
MRSACLNASIGAVAALRKKFLDMDNHPTSTFTSTKVRQAGDTTPRSPVT